MIQTAKTTGTGIARTDLTGAGIRIGVVFVTDALNLLAAAIAIGVVFSGLTLLVIVFDQRALAVGLAILGACIFTFVLYTYLGVGLAV